MYIFLQIHVDCVSYHYGDYRTERLVHSINVVQIHIHRSTYIYSVVHHVRILDKILSGKRTQPLCFHDRDEGNWEDRKFGKVGR
jgi:hypothetical protein